MNAKANRSDAHPLMILETTTDQFNRASERCEARGGEDADRLAARWAGSREFARWQFMFEHLGFGGAELARACTIFSVGVEIGYQLRVAQEEDRQDA